MARKLSFSVESILSDEISTSVHKNDRMETAEAHPMQYYATRNNFQQQHHQIEHQHQHQHQQQQQQQPAQYGASGGNHHRSLSSSIVSMGVQRLPTPPTSPISVASAPSPITVSMMGKYVPLHASAGPEPESVQCLYVCMCVLLCVWLGYA